MPATRRLLLVRHGLPDYRGNKAGDECPGPPLSMLGRDQIKQTAQFLLDYQGTDASGLARASSVFTSPLIRARQTAEILSAALEIPVSSDSDLKEWHRTESLYGVTQRCAHWLHRWLGRDQPTAIIVSHGSPLLAVLRTALYLPQTGWSILDTIDRFEVSMGSVFELVIAPQDVTARRLFHPNPRIMELKHGRRVKTYPRPCKPLENCFIRRPNLGRVIGFSGGNA